MTTMKAMLIERYGKQQPLRLADVPVPAVGEHEILAEIHAASVNPVDFKIRDGKLKVLLHFDMPLILGNDFAGVVRAVGSKVQRFKVGDAVYGRPRKSNIGTFAQFIAAHEDDIAPKPANLSFEEAASVPLVGPPRPILRGVPAPHAAALVPVPAGTRDLGLRLRAPVRRPNAARAAARELDTKPAVPRGADAVPAEARAARRPDRLRFCWRGTGALPRPARPAA